MARTPRTNAFQSRQIRINALPREWDPLFAYAESQGMSPAQAAAELLLAALATNATDPAFIAQARRARYDAQRIVMSEIANGVAQAWKRISERAHEMGIEINNSHLQKKVTP